MAISTQQIGRLGELLVQQEFLEIEIDSSPLTTDSGIDLVALCPKGKFTLQIKTCLEGKPAGGKSKLAIDWHLPVTCPADFNAFVYYTERQVWIFTKSDLELFYKEGFCQKTKKEYHLSMYLETNLSARRVKSRNGFVDYTFEKKKSEFLFSY